MRGASEIVERLREAGFQAYIVGGSVRDRELGLEAKDHDIATDATPEQVTGLFRRVIPTGARHGTVTVLLGESTYEVTTFRRDVSCDGRHAVVEHTSSLEEDLARRDFTVNAMALDPVTGAVLDPFGGREDLRARRIRAVGVPSERFEEDHLRVMRAIRFASQLDFEIDSATWRAVLEKAPMLERISMERVADEFWGVLAGKACARGVRLLREAGILFWLMPELGAMQGMTQPEKWHHLDVLDHTLEAFRNAEGETVDPVTRLAVLLHDVGKPLTRTEDEKGVHFYGHSEAGASMIADIVTRLKLSSSRRVGLDARQLTDRVSELVRLHLRPLEMEAASPQALRRFVKEAGELLDELFVVARCDRLAHRNPDVDALDEVRTRIDELAPPSQVKAAKSPLTGNQIMELLGLEPGPEVGKAKAALEDAIVTGELEAKEEAAKEWLRKAFQRRGR